MGLGIAYTGEGNSMNLETLNDGQLLRLYVEQHDESAFETLVRRHGSMVLGVCRRMLSGAGYAEDAFQTVFLVLCKKGGSMMKSTSITGWLYKVAIRTAQNLRQLIMKDAERKKQLADEAAAEAVRTQTATWDDVSGVLDEELPRLPEKYRLPLILCYIEGRSYEEGSAILGLKYHAMKMRLERAKAMLRDRFERRGVFLEISALTSLITSKAIVEVPPLLSSATIKSASAVLAAKGVLNGVVSANVSMLAKGVLKAMFIQKLSYVAAATAIVVAAGGTAGVAVQKAMADNPDKNGALSQEARWWTEVNYPNKKLPAVSSDFLKWDGVWHKLVLQEEEIWRLRQSIQFLRVMPDLKLTKEQKTALLPLVKKNREDYRKFLVALKACYEEANLHGRNFIRDALAEDIMDKGPGKKKDSPGNFDGRAWNDMLRHVHGPESYGASEDVKKAYAAAWNDMTRDGKEMEAVLTPEQAKGLKPAGLIWTDWRSPLAPVIVQMLAPVSAAWLEKELGMPVSTDPGMEGEIKELQRIATDRKLFWRHYRLTVSPLNWIKGLYLSKDQTKAFLNGAKESLQLHIDQEQKHYENAKALAGKYTQMRDLLFDGKPVPPEFEQEKNALSKYVVSSEWNMVEISPWKYPAPDAAFTQALKKVHGALGSVLKDTQKTVLYDTATCFIPWFTFTDPVNVGGKSLGQWNEGNWEVANIRKVADAKFEQARDSFIKKAMAGYADKAKKKDHYTEVKATAEEESARLKDLLEDAYAMSDAEYEVCKKQVAMSLEGVRPSSEPSGFGLPNLSGPMPERDGMWPKKIGWDRPAVQNRWDEKLSFYIVSDTSSGF